jgi:antitoxin component of MazEF toxin-antitoxin module
VTNDIVFFGGGGLCSNSIIHTPVEIDFLDEGCGRNRLARSLVGRKQQAKAEIEIEIEIEIKIEGQRIAADAMRKKKVTTQYPHKTEKVGQEGAREEVEEGEEEGEEGEEEKRRRVGKDQVE